MKKIQKLKIKSFEIGKTFRQNIQINSPVNVDEVILRYIRKINGKKSKKNQHENRRKT